MSLSPSDSSPRTTDTITDRKEDLLASYDETIKLARKARLYFHVVTQQLEEKGPKADSILEEFANKYVELFKSLHLEVKAWETTKQPCSSIQEIAELTQKLQESNDDYLQARRNKWMEEYMLRSSRTIAAGSRSIILLSRYEESQANPTTNPMLDRYLFGQLQDSVNQTVHCYENLKSTYEGSLSTVGARYIWSEFDCVGEDAIGTFLESWEYWREFVNNGGFTNSSQSQIKTKSIEPSIRLMPEEDGDRTSVVNYY